MAINKCRLREPLLTVNRSSSILLSLFRFTCRTGSLGVKGSVGGPRKHDNPLATLILLITDTGLNLRLKDENKVVDSRIHDSIIHGLPILLILV